jgi:hypothetical protein
LPFAFSAIFFSQILQTAQRHTNINSAHHTMPAEKRSYDDIMRDKMNLLSDDEAAIQMALITRIEETKEWYRREFDMGSMTPTYRKEIEELIEQVVELKAMFEYLDRKIEKVEKSFEEDRPLAPKEHGGSLDCEGGEVDHQGNEEGEEQAIDQRPTRKRARTRCLFCGEV